MNRVSTLAPLALALSLTTIACSPATAQVAPALPAVPAPAVSPPETAAAEPTPGNYVRRDAVRAFAAAVASRHPELPEIGVFQTVAQAVYQPSVARLIMPAAQASAKNWGVYRQRMVDPLRVRNGRAFSERYAMDLRRAEALYGVPAPIIAAIIGIETLYGRDTGNYRTVDALATLAFDFPKGRSDRSAFFRDELEALLVLAARDQMDPLEIRGSYAGALGLPQFMPSSWLKYAVDFDGDGRIDLLRSPVDAIGSVARFLAESGWKRGWATHYRVTPPADAQSMATLMQPDILPTFTPADLNRLDAVTEPAAQQHPGKLALVELRNGLELPPTYVAGTENFYAITRYNWSSYYAMSVIELGRAIAPVLVEAPAAVPAAPLETAVGTPR